MFSRFARETARKVSQQGRRAFASAGSKPAKGAAPAVGVLALSAVVLMNEQKKQAACGDSAVDMAILKELAEIKGILKELDPTQKLLSQIAAGATANPDMIMSKVRE